MEALPTSDPAELLSATLKVIGFGGGIGSVAGGKVKTALATFKLPLLKMTRSTGVFVYRGLALPFAQFMPQTSLGDVQAEAVRRGQLGRMTPARSGIRPLRRGLLSVLFALAWAYLVLEWTLPRALQVFPGDRYPFAGLGLALLAVLLGIVAYRLRVLGRH